MKSWYFVLFLITNNLKAQFIKAGVHLNLIEILGSLKGD